MRFPLIVVVGLALVSASCTDRETPVRQTPPNAAEPAESSEPPESSEPAVDAPGHSAESAAPQAQPPQPPQLLPPEDRQAGWINLFDGRTLFGWEANSDANWSVDDGAVVSDAGEQGLLLTTCELSDYELSFEYRLEPGGNSGVFLHTISDPTDPTRDCYEFNLCDSHESFSTGSLVGRQKPARPIDGEGEWKSFQLRVAGPEITVLSDGETLLEYTDRSPAARRRGRIGLQRNEGRVAFRNLRLRPLGLQELVNNTDLAGWHVVEGSNSRFENVDGVIRVTDGPGFLETDAAWDDFVLQAEVRTNGRHLNSGIFFRAMPGTSEAPSNGYEVQIHNGFEGEDRSRPLDFGTGAIFRRAPARWVVPDDNQWFTLTLVANGPHFAVWVDGHLVTDWTDTRGNDENPRRGRRLEAGHLILQGHDPTTDLSFRNLRLAVIAD